MGVVIGWMHITESAGVILISHNLVGTRRGRWRTCFVKHSEPFPADREDSRKEGWKDGCKLLERVGVGAILDWIVVRVRLTKWQLMSPELKVVAFSEAPLSGCLTTKPPSSLP